MRKRPIQRPQAREGAESEIYGLLDDCDVAGDSRLMVPSKYL